MHPCGVDSLERGCSHRLPYKFTLVWRQVVRNLEGKLNLGYLFQDRSHHAECTIRFCAEKVLVVVSEQRADANEVFSQLLVSFVPRTFCTKADVSNIAHLKSPLGTDHNRLPEAAIEVC